MIDVNEAFQAGAHIVTVPPPFLPKLCAHPKTGEAAAPFLADFRAWSGEITTPPAFSPRRLM